MNEEPVVVTGMGAVSPFGEGIGPFHQGLVAGRCAIKRLGKDGSSLFAAPVDADFVARRYIRDKSLKYVGLASQMLSSAVTMALVDAGLRSDQEEISMVIGTALGNLPQTVAYSRRIMGENPARLSPMSGFDAAQNSAISFTSAACRIRGCVRTVATGWISSSRAIEIGWRMIRLQIAPVVVVGGVEQVSALLNGLFRAQGLPIGRCCSMPFDRGRTGICFGEGSYVLVLEGARRARRRGARLYGEIAGYASSSVAGSRWQLQDPSRVMLEALARAGTRVGAVDAVSAAANSSPAGDQFEGRAICRALGEMVPVTTPKSSIGESCGAAGAAQVVQALLTLCHGELPPVSCLKERDPGVGIANIVTHTRRGRYRELLVNSADPTGAFHSLVVRGSRQD